MQPLLQANYTGSNETSPLGEDAIPLTDEDISWIGGFFCIGGILGTPLYGYFATSFGRKLTLILAALPFILAYGLILIADSSYYIFVARVIAGLGGAGACIIVPMYIGETAEDDIRGVLGSYFNLFICAGILVSYIIGSYTSYFTLSLISLMIPVGFLVASLWLPESPIYLLIKNHEDSAIKSLNKLRGNNKELIEIELTNLSASIRETNTSEEKPSLLDMWRDVGTRKGLIIGTTCMSIQQFSGISPIINYTVAIFEASGSDISPNIATIVVGALQLVGACLGTVLMDRAGRRFLLLLSSIGMGLTLAPIAYFFHLKLTGSDPEFMQSIGWLPVTSMSIYIVVYALGFGPVPFVLIGELFTTEARSIASSICVLYIWFLAFLLLKFFSNLSDLIGIDQCFGLFSACCFAGAAFVYFYIPETKGKSVETILWEMRGKKEENVRNSFVDTNSNTGKKPETTKFEFAGDAGSPNEPDE